MNTTIFPWKMMAIAATALMLLFVVGFLISGKQPVQSQQPAPHMYNDGLPVVADSASVNNSKPLKKEISKTARVQTHVVSKHPLPVNKIIATDSSVNKQDTTTPVVAQVQDEDEATPLNEMLVLDINAQKKPAAKADNAIKKGDNSNAENSMLSAPVVKNVIEAHPQEGWADFEKYLKDGAASPDGITGSVKLSFVVNADGSFTDFKIKTSLSEVADKKAVELVKSGPIWVGNSNKQAKEVNISVDFH